MKKNIFSPRVSAKGFRDGLSKVGAGAGRGVLAILAVIRFILYQLVSVVAWISGLALIPGIIFLVLTIIEVVKGVSFFDTPYSFPAILFCIVPVVLNILSALLQPAGE